MISPGPSADRQQALRLSSGGLSTARAGITVTNHGGNLPVNGPCGTTVPVLNPRRVSDEFEKDISPSPGPSRRSGSLAVWARARARC
jgi:hypothetical protein